MYDFDAWILSFFWCGSAVGQSRFRRPEGSAQSPKTAYAPTCFDADFPRFLHPFPGKQNAPKSYKKALISKKSRLFWWGRVDSNHRRHCQQIYSLSPLATREHPHIYGRRFPQIEAQRSGFDLKRRSSGGSELLSPRRSETIRSLRRRLELVDGFEPPTC